MGGDEAESFGEGRALHVSGGEAEGGGGGDEGVCSAVRGEVEGHVGGGEGVGEVRVAGPAGEGRPVIGGVGDDAGLVLGDEVSEELEWGWREIQSVQLAGVA